MKKFAYLKPTHLFWMVLVMVLPLLVACGKSKDAYEKTKVVCEEGEVSSNDFGVELVVYDRDGNKTNTIKEGEDFSIFLQFINNTDETLSVSQSDYQRLLMHFYPQEDCLLIYKKGVKRPVGQPYDRSIDLVFQDINLPPREVHPKDMYYRIGYPWSHNPHNKRLTKGKYYSSFKDKVMINGVNVCVDTVIEFEVK